MMFIPATSWRLPFAAASARSTPAPWESSSAEAARRPGAEQLLAGQPVLALVRLAHLFLRKMSTALLPNEVE